MTEDLIQLPKAEEIKEMLDLAKTDIQSEIEQDPELKPASELLINVINVIENQVAEIKNFRNLDNEEKISLAAHLHFLQSLLEDFFMFEDFEDDEDFEDLDNEEYEDEDEK